MLKDEEYNLFKRDGIKVIFQKSSGYPEDCIEIQKNKVTHKFIVQEVHRDVKKIKLETEDEVEADICAVIMYKRMCDDIAYGKKTEQIRDFINTANKDEILDFIADKFDSSLYSINNEDAMKISLLSKDNKVDIKFAGEYIVHNITWSRGYIVLCNYCEKLQYICLYLERIQTQLQHDFDREKMIKWYILG